MKNQNNVSKIKSQYVTDQDKARKFEVRRKQNERRRMVLWLILATLIISGMQMYSNYKDDALAKKKTENQQIKAASQAEEKKTQQFNQEINNLNQDEYLAKLARSEYFLTKDGEVIFSTPDKEK